MMAHTKYVAYAGRKYYVKNNVLEITKKSRGVDYEKK